MVFSLAVLVLFVPTILGTWFFILGSPSHILTTDS